MPVRLDPDLRDGLLARIRTFRSQEIREAVRLADTLPLPGEELADEVAAVLHEVALHAESLADWALCASLYRRVAGYPVADLRIRAGALYRHGLCQEHIGDFLAAIRSFREALPCAEGWPALLALTRLHLARLLMAAEEFDDAAAALEHVTTVDGVSEVEAGEVEVTLCRCLVRLDRVGEARSRLEVYRAGAEGSDRFAEAVQLLAGIYESAGEMELAVQCYESLIASGQVDPQTKLAAAHRLAALRKR